MMFAMLRFLVLALIVQTVIFVILWIRWRNAKQEELEQDWLSQGQPDDREQFIDQGLAESGKQRRTMLFLLVYVLPICIVASIIYLTNFH
ncbi:hypothetical protein TRP8649_00695 [Pelagimonas phthalicica]|uniref:Uncharacterized protein n=2 Tax=Pelagimonas phthalicica TaxID=1037362 RepID=A0A238J796_9RHOB|nr:hypothetical protein CLV87_1376 [Pelagimonas phthalicica]SMX26611.1 hypothetical protein TRP8649_00695 [Pelagimonas phthalicica]